MNTEPALVSILRQGSYLIASIHTALDDSQMLRFQQDLIEKIGQHRSRGVIIDVAALDVVDSFGPNAAPHRRDRPTAWCNDGHRGHPAGRGVRHGEARHGHGFGAHRPGPGGRPGLPRQQRPTGAAH